MTRKVFIFVVIALGVGAVFFVALSSLDSRSNNKSFTAASKSAQVDISKVLNLDGLEYSGNWDVLYPG